MVRKLNRRRKKKEGNINFNALREAEMRRVGVVLDAKTM